MTRGKHGAAAAGRALEDAHNQMSTLALELADTKAKSAAREQELAAELQNLRGKFQKAVREAASEAVMAAKDAGRAALAEAEEAQAERSREVVRFLSGFPGLALPGDSWTDLAQILGLQIGEVLELCGVAGNRRARRMTNRMANDISNIKRHAAASGMKL